MSSVPIAERAEPVARRMLRLLHGDEPDDAFARELDAAEGLPAGAPGRAARVEAVRWARDIRERLESQRERERGLLAVIDSARDLSSRLDVDGLLRAFVSRARHLLGADLAWLTVHDGDRDEFRVMLSDGALAAGTSTMVTRRDRGVVGRVMATRLPFTTGDYLHDRRFVHDPELDAVFRAEGIASLVGVPLVWEGDVVGLLFVADRYHRAHSAQHIAILCTLATHGAVALRNARDFARATAALEDADRTRAELERHVRAIQSATEAHVRLTSLLARGASLATLCREVAELLGAAMLVLDEAGRVVARARAPGYTASGADDYAPHRTAGIAEALRASRRTGRAAVAFDDGHETCRVMPVIGGADVLGTLVLYHGAGFEEISLRTFERASSIVGIVLLSEERAEAGQYRDASALLRAVLSPGQSGAATLADQAARVGVDLASPLSLTVVAADGPGAGFATRRLRASPTFAGVLVDEVDDRVAILAPATRSTDVRRVIADFARAELGAEWRAVQSRPIAALADVPSLFASLGRALPLLARLGIGGQVIGQDELALYATLFESQDRASLGAFLDANIGPLLAHDRQRNTALAATLLAYFDGNRNAKATARKLGIHVNTMRQRLATIETLVGHDGQAARALELHIALRLWHLSPRER